MRRLKHNMIIKAWAYVACLCTSCISIASWAVPSARQETLANGLRIVVVEDSSSELAHVQLWLHAGPASVPMAHPVAAAFLANALRHPEGPAQLSLTRVLASGAEVSVELQRDALSIDIQIANQNLTLALTHLARLMRSDICRTKDIETARTRQKEATVLAVDARREALQLLLGLHYQRSALRQPKQATSMEGFDSSSCQGFSKQAISPKRAVLVVVGPTPFDAVKRAATQQLGTWRKRSDDNLATIQEEPRRGARQAELHLAAAQAGLAMAYSMPQLGSDQEALASLAIHMLLSPEYGLLRQTNRPYKNVRGNVINSRDAAALLLFVDADTDTDARTLGSQVETDIALRFQDLTAGDFKHAQSDQSRRLWRARLDPHELATRLGEACLLGQGPASVLNLAERVAALNIDALKSFAKKTFDPMQRSTVLLTPSQLADEQPWPETFVHCLQYRWPPPAQQEVP